MKKQLSHSTKYIDVKIKQYQENAKHGLYTNTDYKELLYQRLDKRIAEQSYDWIINSLCDLFFEYAGCGDIRMQLDADRAAAKESYYIAALIGVLCYEMIEKGFSHHVLDSGYPFDFKKNNFSFSKAAILANEHELALKITGTDTVEGALVSHDYPLACALLPKSPEDDSISTDEIQQCMWAIAYADEKLFNKYLEKRIKMLRRYAPISPTTFDSWGLTAIKLAQQRGIQCNLNVIELPYHLLDDNRIETSGLTFPKTAQIRSIIDEKESQIKG